MLILSARFSRKKRILVFSLLIFLITGLLSVSLIPKKKNNSKEPRYAPQNEQRVAFLQSYGWAVEEQPIETLILPFGESLQEPFLSYNKLQLQQGFDLSACCNKTVQRFSYKITNYPGRNDCQANLYLCENRIVAADITCLGDNGFMKDLQFPGGKKA